MFDLHTPVLSKVFERLLSKRLYAYTETNGLFPSLQFGFRKGLGTCDAVLITSAVQNSLDTGHEVCIIDLNFSSAFDRVNHEALFFKLRQMGIDGTFLNIIVELLTGRKQRVVVDGQCSDYRNVISGVPQGSVLGTLLFILYTSDMWCGLENGLVAYEDDATFFVSVLSPHLRLFIAESLNRDLVGISLKMNLTKTQCMTVSRSRTAFSPHPDLFIDDV